MSRKTIGENPLDSLLTPAEPAKKQDLKPSVDRPKKQTKVESNGDLNHGDLKQRLTVQISAHVLERAKNAVYWTRGLTLAKLTEQALEKAIASLEKSAVVFDDTTGESLKSKGDSFPKRQEELKSGRPVK